MVHNPKNSQMILVWCLESALGLIFKAAEVIGEKISRSELNEYFSQNTSEEVSSRQISKMIYELKKRDYLDWSEGDSVRLTEKAKIKIIDQISETKERDGKYRLISFDIPEIKRQNRNNFRRAIKRIGFKQVQKSLWVSDRNVGELVEAAANEYKVNDYIAYFVADKSNIDKYLKKVLRSERLS
jgi:CRISPR-associated endonuclease Cas2